MTHRIAGILVVLVVAAGALAEPYPRAGWEATLSTEAHSVSGTVSIVDADTVHVSDFTYDGQGISVYFYLGADDSYQSFANGLAIGYELLGTVFTGESFDIDLPGGHTLEGYTAISVWCVPAGANFGSGTFVMPEPTPLLGDANGDGQVDGNDLISVEENFGATGDPYAPGDANGDGQVDGNDLISVEENFGAFSDIGVDVSAVPEPMSLALLSIGAFAALARRRR